jgi:hypothetical protein
MSEVHDQITRMVGGGATLDAVEAEIIDLSPLGADERAALWLYAWTLVSRRSGPTDAPRFERPSGRFRRAAARHPA